MKKFFYFSLLMAMPAMAQQNNQVATFEDLPLEKESFWNGSDGTGGFTSGMYHFENGCDDYGTYLYAYGFYYSNMTLATFAEYATDQYNSCVGHGAEGSATYAVFNLNAYNPKGIQVLTDTGEGAIISGCYVTNAASAYKSMLNGDDYAKKFEAGDWFKVTFIGKDATGAETGCVDFYLADFRQEAYIVNDWQWVDLSSLGKVARIDFDMSSSDSGQWGMNTPAYFCLDNFGAENPQIPVAVQSLQSDSNTPVAIYSLNGVRQNTLQKGLNIVKYADGMTKKVIVR